ncbi:MAG TPA: hypothetical protein VF221_08145 [Chloroflexota bacterium]
MEILYAGGASFVVRGDRTVVINPLRPVEKVEIALHGNRQKRGRAIVNGPGEYEIGGVLIVSARNGDKQSDELLHAITIDDLTVAFVQKSRVGLLEQASEDLGKIDVLLIGTEDISAAQKAVQGLEPRVVIPHGARASELAAALGVKDIQPQPRFIWNGTAKVSKVVLLKAPSARRRAA